MFSCGEKNGGGNCRSGVRTVTPDTHVTAGRYGYIYMNEIHKSINIKYIIMNFSLVGCILSGKCLQKQQMLSGQFQIFLFFKK